MARNNPRINEVTLLSAAFIRWGLGLFIFGLIIGYSPLVHYLHGVLEKMGETTLQNAALWLASPYAVQIGGLGQPAPARWKLQLAPTGVGLVAESA